MKEKQWLQKGHYWKAHKLPLFLLYHSFSADKALIRPLSQVPLNLISSSVHFYAPVLLNVHSTFINDM